MAGTGEQCPPFDEARCGDGRKATEAQLLGPKGTYTNTRIKIQGDSFICHFYAEIVFHTSTS